MNKSGTLLITFCCISLLSACATYRSPNPDQRECQKLLDQGFNAYYTAKQQEGTYGPRLKASAGDLARAKLDFALQEYPECIDYAQQGLQTILGAAAE